MDRRSFSPPVETVGSSSNAAEPHVKATGQNSTHARTEPSSELQPKGANQAQFDSLAAICKSEWFSEHPTPLNDYLCYNARPNNPKDASLIIIHLKRFPQVCDILSQIMLHSIIFCLSQKFCSYLDKSGWAYVISSSSEKPAMEQAMVEEIQAFEANQTCIVEDLPPGKKPISCKWVYWVKYNSDGSIQRYKARLVIQGDH